MAGQPSLEQAAALGAIARSAHYNNRPYIWGSIPVFDDSKKTKAVNSNAYPYKPLPSDPLDSRIKLIDDLSRRPVGEDGKIIENSKEPLVTPARPLPITEEELAFMERKRDAEEYAAFFDWITHRYPSNDPANRMLLTTIMPEFIEVRKRNLEEQIQLQADYARIRLTGPQSQEDLMKEYLVETGRVTIPEGPFHDPMRWLENEMQARLGKQELKPDNVAEMNSLGYERGLFNPFYLYPKKGPYATNDMNPSDIRGDPSKTVRGPFGVKQVQSENWLSYVGKMLGYPERKEQKVSNENVNAYSSWGARYPYAP